MTLEEAIETVKSSCKNEEYRTYSEWCEIWADRNAPPSGYFNDWRMANATGTILNAVIGGELVKK